MPPPRLAVIILNWNNVTDTLRCLAALASVQQRVFQTIVVDNASTDGSPEIIRAKYPEVTIVHNEINLGYTGGNNVGIAHALTQGVDYMLLLNDDAVIAKDAIEKLMVAAAQHPMAGFLGPKILSLEDPDQVLSAGGYLGPDGRAQHRDMGQKAGPEHQPVMEVDYLSGCALLISRAVVEKAGPLDEAFFAYGEDVEWCVRGARAGFKVLLVPLAIVWHPDTRLRDENSPRVLYYITRNHLLLLRKHRLGAASLARAQLRNAILLANWTLNPKWRQVRPKRDALWLALRDFALGRFGKSADF